MYTKDTKINSFYVIVTGLFKYKLSKANEHKIWQNYTHWQNRINGGDYKASFEYFNISYYDGYLNNMFPSIRHDKSRRDDINPDFLNHLTHKNYYNKQTDIDLIIYDENKISAKIDFIDIYLFPNEIGIFSIKYVLPEKYLTLGVSSDFINKIRQLNSSIIINNRQTSIKSFIENDILQSFDIQDNWVMHNPQLKTYNILDLHETIPEEEMNYLLYDIGNVAPIGTANGDGIFTPSEAYLKEQIDNNRISVFKNWAALILFDTFTRISNNFPDNFKSWELDYFQIYIHSLHIKSYMYLTNSRISDVTSVTKETEQIRDNFIEFINDYYQTHISYKFMPDLIQSKLLFALEIDSEVQVMETKIQRINEHAQEKRERKMNMGLSVITFLSVLSLIYTLSRWTVDLGAEKSFVFPWGSLIISAVIIVSILFLFKISKR